MTGSDDESRLRLVERLLAFDCCTVSDALDRLKLAGQVPDLPHRSGAARIAGIAVTIKLGTGEPPPGPPRHLGVEAIRAADSTSIIVIEQRTGIECGCWGGLLTIAAGVKGIRGVVADGHVRDIDEARERGFTIFSRGVATRTARGRIVEKSTNVPVQIGDTAVEPGDFVLADGSGVVFVKADRIEEVLAVAQSIAEREAGMAEALRLGANPADVLGGAYEHMLKK